MDPITIAAIASAVGALSKAGLAAAQNAKSKKLANQPRPQQQVPTSVQEATQNAQQAYQNPNLLNSATTNLRSNAADANYALQQSGGNTNAITAAIAGQQNNALNSLYQAQQQRKDSLRGALGQQLNLQGQYEQSNFDVNKLQPYLDAMKASAAQKGAATQNLGGAVTDAVGGLTSIGGMVNSNNQNAELLKLLSGGAERVEGTGTNLPSKTIASIVNSVGKATPAGTGVLALPNVLPSAQLASMSGVPEGGTTAISPAGVLALPSAQLASMSGTSEGGAISPTELSQIEGAINAQKNTPSILQKGGLTAVADATAPLEIPKSVEKKTMSAISGMSKDELLELAKTPQGMKILQYIIRITGLINTMP